MSKPSVCYLSSDYQKYKEFMPTDVIVCPENTKNAQQIQEWVHDLKTTPKVFFTCSLYLIRELEIQKIYVQWINMNPETLRVSFCVDDIGSIEILQRDLDQCDRYLDFHYARGR